MEEKLFNRPGLLAKFRIYRCARSFSCSIIRRKPAGFSYHRKSTPPRTSGQLMVRTQRTQDVKSWKVMVLLNRRSRRASLRDTRGAPFKPHTVLLRLKGLRGG